MTTHVAAPCTCLTCAPERRTTEPYPRAYAVLYGSDALTNFRAYLAGLPDDGIAGTDALNDSVLDRYLRHALPGVTLCTPPTGTSVGMTKWALPTPNWVQAWVFEAHRFDRRTGHRQRRTVTVQHAREAFNL